MDVNSLFVETRVEMMTYNGVRTRKLVQSHQHGSRWAYGYAPVAFGYTAC